MRSEFPERTIGETCYVTDGAHSKVERQPQGILYLTSKNIGVGNLILDKIDYVSSKDYERLFSNTAKAQRRPTDGDVLIGIIGTFGNAYRYKHDDHFGVSSAVAIIRPHQEFLDSNYLYYVVTSSTFKAVHSAYKSGSVQGYTNIPTIKQLPLPCPPLADQKAIAHILGTLDDKIELNRQMNTTLEALAQALFKSWFVDFDPVIDNALAAGNPIPDPLQARAAARQVLGEQRKPLPETIRQQFPCRFEFSEEVGWVPEGWAIGCFGDVSQQVRKNVKVENISEFDFYIGLEHISKKQLFLADNGTGETIGSNKSGFMEDDLLFGKLRPYFHKVCLAPVEGICSTDILVFRAKRREFHSYMALTAFTDAFVEYANIRSTGTRMPRASAKDMLAYSICIPPVSVLSSFDGIVKPMWKKGMESIENNRALSKARDTLLPKLLSGELRIPAVEKLLTNAL